MHCSTGIMDLMDRIMSGSMQRKQCMIKSAAVRMTSFCFGRTVLETMTPKSDPTWMPGGGHQLSYLDMPIQLARFGHNLASSARINRSILSSRYATVSDRVVKFRLQDPSSTTAPIPKSIHPTVHVSPAFDYELLSKLSQLSIQTSIKDLNEQYNQFSGHILDIPLPYESTPPNNRKLRFGPGLEQQNKDGVLAVAHCIDSGNDHKVGLSSGFALNIPVSSTGEYAVVTCAHTFEEASRSSC
jgi:hypothetical protein